MTDQYVEAAAMAIYAQQHELHRPRWRDTWSDMNFDRADKLVAYAAANVTITALQSLGYLPPSDVEAACVAAQRVAFEKARQKCFEMADAISEKAKVSVSDKDARQLAALQSLLFVTTGNAIAALSPSPVAMGRVPEGSLAEKQASLGPEFTKAIMDGVEELYEP